MDLADLQHHSRMIIVLERRRQQALMQEANEEARRHENILRRSRRLRLRRDRERRENLNRPVRIDVPQLAPPVALPPAPRSPPLPEFIDNDARNDEANFLRNEEHNLAMGARWQFVLWHRERMLQLLVRGEPAPAG